MQFVHKMKNKNVPHIFLKLFSVLVPCLFHQFFLNKLLSTASIPKNYTVCNISTKGF